MINGVARCRSSARRSTRCGLRSTQGADQPRHRYRRGRRRRAARQRQPPHRHPVWSHRGADHSGQRPALFAKDTNAGVAWRNGAPCASPISAGLPTASRTTRSPAGTSRSRHRPGHPAPAGDQHHRVVERIKQLLPTFREQLPESIDINILFDRTCRSESVPTSSSP